MPDAPSGRTRLRQPMAPAAPRLARSVSPLAGVSMEETQDVNASGDGRTWPLAAALTGRGKHMEPLKRVPCPRALASPLTALVLALASVVLMAPVPPEDPARDYSERMFIGQFNMAGGSDEYGGHGSEAPEALVRSIKGRSPALAFVTINEGCKDWLDYLDEQLPDYNVKFDPVFKNDDKGNPQPQPCKHDSQFGNAIVYRKDFSDFQTKSYELQDAVGHAQRKMLCLGSDSKRLVVCTVHLVSGEDHREQREQEAERVRRWLAKDYAGYTVILGGDLNDEPGSEALSSFYLSDYGQDAHGALKEVDSPCGDDINERDSCRDGEHTHGELPGGLLGGINEKFDYLFVSPKVTVHDADATKSLYSDHDPLWADVEVTYPHGEQRSSPPAQPPPAASLPRYVAMGDSFSSGDGAGDYYPPTGDRPEHCKRSRNAYSQVIASRVEGALRHDPQQDFVACSGAKAKDVLNDIRNKHLGHLDESVGLVTISIGGNDLDWANTIVQCVRAQFYGPDNRPRMPFPGLGETCNNIIKKVVDPKLGGVLSDLQAILQEIKMKSSNAQVIVVGYPVIMEPTDRAKDCVQSAGQFVPTGMRGDVRDATARINKELRAVAEREGARFVEPAPNFEGHQICGEGSEWFNGLHGDEAPFHPNKAGQRGYASAILPHLNAPLDDD
ncbi:hypothetical protein D7X55_26880 [Corallococcus sp. AB049A]|nr:hypothetical protein D7X55_26880 [Corallococcus sp. AB049A]